MKVVGIRELKNRLSEYIRDVRRGDSVLITDRGEVVAEIGPPGHRVASSHHPPGLEALARRGLATLSQKNDGRAYRQFRRALKPGRAAALLAEERGNR